MAVSEEALAKVNHLFQEEKKEEEEEQEEVEEEQGMVTAAAPVHTLPPPAPPAACGFQTGRGKTVTVSEKAMSKVHKLFEEKSGGAAPAPLSPKLPAAPLASGAAAAAPPAASFGFQTGRGKQVAVSEEALAKVDHLFTEGGGEPAALGAPPPPPAPTSASAFGFQTGRGKQLDVSKEALAKVNHLFEEEGGSAGTETAAAPPPPVAGTPPGAFGFQTGRDKQVAVSEAALAKVGHLFKEQQESGAAGPPPPQPPPAAMGGGAFGFQTGRGKQVDVSEAALAKVGHLFEEQGGGDGGNEMAAGGPPPGLPQPPPPAPGGAFGFQTGRGNKVAVSEEALAKVGHLFEQEQSHGEAAPMAGPPPPPPPAPAPGGAFGFQTGRGKQVAVSEESMAKVGHLFEEQGEAAVAVAGPPPPPLPPAPGGGGGGSAFGFQTGRGKAVDVSEEALAQVGHLFEQEESETGAGGAPAPMGGPPTPPSAPAGGRFGFQTGRGKQVDVSEEVLSKVDHLFEVGAKAPEEATTASVPAPVTADMDVVKKEATEVEKSDDQQQQQQPAPPPPLQPVLPASQPEAEKEKATATAKVEDPSQVLPTAPALSTLPFASTLPLPTQCQDVDLLDLRALAQDKYGGANGSDAPKRLKLSDLGLYPGSIPRQLLPSYGVRPATMAVTSANGHRLRFGDADGLPAALVDAPSPAAEDPKATLLPPDESAALSTAILAAPACMGKGTRPPPSEKWLAHHYRLVVWKLASLERSFPDVLGGRYLTRARVLKQLQYRYVREMVCGNRPALRLILNGDAPAGRLMILCVSQVYQQEPVSNAQGAEKEKDDEDKENKAEGAAPPSPPPQPLLRVELTDGWYCVDALLDTALSALASKGRLCVGSKLVVCNASLQGVSGGIDPLEVAGQAVEARPYLKLAMNATRPARWDAPLGFQQRPCKHTNGVLAVPISGLVAGGGPAPSLEVVILRRYPTQYMERRQNRTVTRVLTVAEEEDAQSRHESTCQAQMERLLEEKNREAQAEERERRRTSAHRRGMVHEANEDRDYAVRQAEMAARMDEARREVLDDPSFQRESKAFFRVKVCSVKSRPTGTEEEEEGGGGGGYALAPDWTYHSVQEVRHNMALLTIWEPSEVLEDALQEGRHVMLYNVVAPPLKGDGPPPALFRLNGSGKSCQVRPLSSSSSSLAVPAPPTSVFAYPRYEPRQVMPSIRAAKERFSKQRGPFVSHDFDMVGVHLASIVWETAGDGKHETSQFKDKGSKPVMTRIFFTDPSGCILCVEKRDYDKGSGSGSGGSSSSSNGLEEEEAGAVWALTDLSFQSYDAKTDTVMATLSGWSGMRKAVYPRAAKDAYVRAPMAALTQWAGQTEDGQRVLEEERNRLLSLLSRDDGDSVGGGTVASPLPPRERFQGSLTQVEATTVDGGGGQQVLRLLADLAGHGYLPVVCRRQYTLRRLTAALLPEGTGPGQDEVDVMVAGTLAQTLMERQAGWGSLLLDLLVQRTDGAAPDVLPSFELLDVGVVSATKCAFRALNHLLTADSDLALLAASVITTS